MVETSHVGLVSQWKDSGFDPECDRNQEGLSYVDSSGSMEDIMDCYVSSKECPYPNPSTSECDLKLNMRSLQT